MFDHLVKANNLEPVMKQHGLMLPEDLVFIKEQIAGPLSNGASLRSQVPVAVHTIDIEDAFILLTVGGQFRSDWEELVVHAWLSLI